MDFNKYTKVRVPAIRQSENPEKLIARTQWLSARKDLWFYMGNYTIEEGRTSQEFRFKRPADATEFVLRFG